MTASTGGRRPSARSSIKLADLCGQVAQCAYPNGRDTVRIEIVLLDDAPRTTADQRGLHPGPRSGTNVIVQAVVRRSLGPRLAGERSAGLYNAEPSEQRDLAIVPREWGQRGV